MFLSEVVLRHPVHVERESPQRGEGRHHQQYFSLGEGLPVPGVLADTLDFRTSNSDHHHHH